MGSKNAVKGMTKINGGEGWNQWKRQLISLDKKMQLFPCNILYWFCHLRGYASIDFHWYILCFCVAIYFREDSSAYAGCSHRYCGWDKKYPCLGWLATNQCQRCHEAVTGKIPPFPPYKYHPVYRPIEYRSLGPWMYKFTTYCRL